jgi:hypothetical protein
MSKNTEKKNTEKKSTYQKRVVAVTREATVDVNGTEVKVNVKMYAIAEDERERLELENEPEFTSRKAAQAFIKARREELRGTPTLRKLDSAVKRSESMTKAILAIRKLVGDGDKELVGLLTETWKNIESVNTALRHAAANEAGSLGLKAMAAEREIQ